MSDPLVSHIAMLAALRAMRGGLASALPPGTTQVVAGGQVSTIPQLESELDGYIGVYQAAEDADAAAQKADKAREDLAVTVVPRFEALRTAFKGMYGRKSPDLAKIGLEPDKTPPAPTVEQKQERVAKAQATRKARGTMGPKQKAAIKGQAPAPTPPAGPAKTGA